MITDAFMQHAFAGIVAGVSECIVGYPLETMKARMQTQNTAFLTVLHKSQNISSLYRGALPQIIRSALSSSVLFGLTAKFRTLYTPYIHSEYSLLLAASSTGITEALLYTPFETVKLQMQTLGKTSNVRCAREIVRSSGYRGLYRGFLPMAAREGIGNAVYFLTYERLKRGKLGMMEVAVSGGFAGVMYWLVVFPADTVKSVMQGGKGKSRLMECVRELVLEGGVRRFYKGMSPCLVRAFPANAIAFLAFEGSLRYMGKGVEV